MLDFDGVICNSIDECLLTSYNAYHDTSITGVTEIPQTFRNYFRKYRHMVRPAGEYYLLYVAFNVQTEPFNHEVFLELRDHNQQALDDFSKQFFAERTVQKDNITNWLSLHNIYPHVSDFLKKHDRKIFIVTTKDGDSVSSLMEYFGFAKMVQEIYSREISEKKDQLFTRLLSEYADTIQPGEINFVDDSEWHLADLQHMGINLFFAEWGYAKVQEYHNFKSIRDLGELS